MNPLSDKISFALGSYFQWIKVNLPHSKVASHSIDCHFLKNKGGEWIVVKEGGGNKEIQTMQCNFFFLYLP